MWSYLCDYWVDLLHANRDDAGNEGLEGGARLLHDELHDLQKPARDKAISK